MWLPSRLPEIQKRRCRLIIIGNWRQALAKNPDWDLDLLEQMRVRKKHSKPKPLPFAEALHNLSQGVELMGTPIAARIRRLLRKNPVLPSSVAKVYNPKGQHVADLVMNGKTGTRRRVRVAKRRKA